jgi:hypothetical protein
LLLFRYAFLRSFSMTATHNQDSSIPTVPVLYFSLELSSKSWKLAFTTGLGQTSRSAPKEIADLPFKVLALGSFPSEFGSSAPNWSTSSVAVLLKTMSARAGHGIDA